MPTPSYTAGLLIGVGALALGLLLGLAWFHHRTRAGFVPLAVHRDEVAALRRRYRRRLRALRDASLRHRAGEQQLRGQLQLAEQHNATQARLRAAAEAAATEYRGRLEAQDALLAARDQALAAGQARAAALEAALHDAQERVAALERDEGLMRIERDELVARTLRLRTLAPAPADPEGPAVAPAGGEGRPAAAGGASRVELAERNARIHDLECALRESATRIGELESSLHTWKYRIAPLALHMKMQRDRARQGAPRRAPAAAAHDDLKRIRGIGRMLERKMHAAGVRQFDQIAAMSPAELANLARRIGVAGTRPLRERWAEQARAMLAQAPPAGPAGPPAASG